MNASLHSKAAIALLSLAELVAPGCSSREEHLSKESAVATQSTSSFKATLNSEYEPGTSFSKLSNKEQAIILSSQSTVAGILERVSEKAQGNSDENFDKLLREEAVAAFSKERSEQLLDRVVKINLADNTDLILHIPYREAAIFHNGELISSAWLGSRLEWKNGEPSLANNPLEWKDAVSPSGDNALYVGYLTKFSLERAVDAVEKGVAAGEIPNTRSIFNEAFPNFNRYVTDPDARFAFKLLLDTKLMRSGALDEAKRELLVNAVEL